MRSLTFPLALLCALGLSGCGQAPTPVRSSPPPVDPALLQQSLKSLESGESAEKLQAVQELAKMGAQGKQAVPQLRTLLTSSDRDLKKGAILALTRIGTAALDAKEDLRQVYESETDPELQRLAYIAMAEVDS